jgi:hypothetical protein
MLLWFRISIYFHNIQTNVPFYSYLQLRVCLRHYSFSPYASIYQSSVPVCSLTWLIHCIPHALLFFFSTSYRPPACSVVG